MGEINPAHVLIVVVAVSLATISGTLVLILTGNRNDVSTFLGLTGPILGSLFSYKLYLIHQVNHRSDALIAEKVEVIRHQTNSELDRLIVEMARLQAKIDVLNAAALAAAEEKTRQAPP